MPSRRLLLFTKPAREGRVKTRLIGDLTAAQAAALHSAFLDDLLDRLREGDFELCLAWDLDASDEVPAGPIPGIRQQGEDLGERLYQALVKSAGGLFPSWRWGAIIPLCRSRSSMRRSTG